MFLEVFHHTEGTETFGADDLEEFVVADGVLLILRVL
jgi:hypothetical protein